MPVVKHVKSNAQIGEFNFLPGWGQLKGDDLDNAMQKIMEVLKIEHPSTFSRYLRGLEVPDANEIKGINSVFKYFKVTKNIWSTQLSN